MRENITKWLSPPDPSINYNTARDAHYEGTAVWFAQSNTFKDWKASGSLLWIHGKRVFPPPLFFIVPTDRLSSGLWEERTYVCCTTRLTLAE